MILLGWQYSSDLTEIKKIHGVSLVRFAISYIYEADFTIHGTWVWYYLRFGTSKEEPVICVNVTPFFPIPTIPVYLSRETFPYDVMAENIFSVVHEFLSYVFRLGLYASLIRTREAPINAINIIDIEFSLHSNLLAMYMFRGPNTKMLPQPTVLVI
jgi:hypothetical protein